MSRTTIGLYNFEFLYTAIKGIFGVQTTVTSVPFRLKYQN